MTVELAQMGRKRDSKGVLALDGHDNKLEEKNAVEVIEGALMRTQAAGEGEGEGWGQLALTRTLTPNSCARRAPSSI